MMSGDDPTQMQAASLPAGIPQSVGRYRVQRLLGRGGMGVVLLALDEALGRQVALKLIAAGGAITAAERARFEREARSAAQLNHPNIAALYDIGSHEGQPFLTMEYVAGETLAQRIAHGPLPIAAVSAVAEQLAAALSAAHSAGVVHRDLKPGNVMVTADGAVKLLDFGLARPAERAAKTSGDPITQTGMIIGTPAYMSPEQARGEDVAAASDVFSLGTLLYESLTGRCPFARNSMFDALNAVVVHEPPPVTDGRPDTPGALAGMISRCLAKDPASRPPTMQLISLLSGKPVAPTLGVAMTKEQQAAGPRLVPGMVAVMPFKNLTGKTDHDWIGIGLTDTLGHELRRSAGVTLVAEAAVAALAAELDSAQALGRQTGAEWVIKGAYQVAGPRLRITCSALHVAPGDERSCDRVDGALDDIFELQDHVIGAVRETLHAPRRQSSPSLGATPVPKDREAYELYSRGLMLLRGLDGRGLPKAKELFARALARDPEYALAHVGMGIVRQLMFFTEGAALEPALASLERALELDPGCAMAHAWISQVHMFMRNYEAGIAHGERAVALDPVSLDGWLFLGLNHTSRTHCEGAAAEDLAAGIRCFERALEVAPHYASIHHNIAVYCLLCGDVDRADRHFVTCDQLNRGGARYERWPGGQAYRGMVALWRGDLSAAEPLLRDHAAELEGEDHFAALPMRANLRLSLGELLLRKGDADEALEIFETTRAMCAEAAELPGMRHALVRALLGLTRASNLKGDGATRDAWLASAEEHLKDAELRRQWGYDCLAAHTLYDAASTYAGLGRADAAYAFLVDAIGYGMLCAPRYDNDPAFDEVRERSHFAAQRARMDAFRFAEPRAVPGGGAT